MAVAIANVALFVVGIVICLVGVVAGKVLSMAGDGAKTFARLSLPHDALNSAVSLFHLLRHERVLRATQLGPSA